MWQLFISWQKFQKTAAWRDTTFEKLLPVEVDKADQLTAFRAWESSPHLPVSPAQLKIAAWWRSAHYLTKHVTMLDVAGECQIHIKGSDAAHSLNLLIVSNAHFLLWKPFVVLPGITEMDIWSHGARAELVLFKRILHSGRLCVTSILFGEMWFIVHIFMYW